MKRHCITIAALILLYSAPTMAQEAPTIPDMNGTWAQLQVTTTVSELPVVGDVIGTTTSLLLLSVSQDDDKLSIKETICNIDITSTAKRVRTILPSAFQRAASGTKRKATITIKDGTLHYKQHPKTVTLGAKLSKSNRTLPEDEDDPRVVDADKDGKPGLTVKIEGIIDGEIYIVQSGWNKLTGTMDNQGIISGKMAWKSTQKVVDASSIFLKSNPSSKPHGGTAKNFFKMKQVSPSTTCSDLKKNYTSWLGAK